MKGNSVIKALNGQIETSLHEGGNVNNTNEIVAAFDKDAEQMVLDYFSLSDLSGITDKIINKGVVVVGNAVVPGSGNAVKKVSDNTGVKPSDITINPVKMLVKASSKLTDLFKKKSKGSNNNAEMRAELDKFIVPSDFDIDRYGWERPDAVAWSKGFGLNDGNYERKALASHWFMYSEQDKQPYPYKAGTAPIKGITMGSFDWIGGQDNGQRTGFHSQNVPIGLKAGDKVKITVIQGDTSYNGIHPVTYIGADDGTYKESMFTLTLPKTVNTLPTNGIFELMADTVQTTTSGELPKESNTMLYVVIALVVLVIIGALIYFKTR